MAETEARRGDVRADDVHAAEAAENGDDLQGSDRNNIYESASEKITFAHILASLPYPPPHPPSHDTAAASNRRLSTGLLLSLWANAFAHNCFGMIQNKYTEKNSIDT